MVKSRQTSKEDVKALMKVIRSLQRFSAFDNKMQVSTILTLLEIAKHELTGDEISTADIERLVGMVSGTSSRNIYYWGEGHKAMAGGHEMVDIAMDTNDRRRRTLKLTPKGKTFVNQLLDAING